MLNRKFRKVGHKNGEDYGEMSIRGTMADLGFLVDSCELVLNQLQQMGRPLPPPHRRPLNVMIALRHILADFHAGTRRVDGNLPDDQIERLAKELRRLTIDDYQRLEGKLSDDEFIIDSTDEMPEPGLRGWDSSCDEGGTLRAS